MCVGEVINRTKERTANRNSDWRQILVAHAFLGNKSAGFVDKGMTAQIKIPL